VTGFEFDSATAVEATGEGRWSGVVQPGWDIGGNANGGYVLSILGRAMREAAGRRDPITLTAHYLAPSAPGPVQLETRVIKSGKRFTTASGEIRDVEGGRVRMTALGAFGDAADGMPDYASAGPPELPPFEECPERAAHNGAVLVAFASKVAVRLHPNVASFHETGQLGTGLVTGWFGFKDGRPVDTLSVLLACDAFVPAIFTLDQPGGWVPTVELTVQVRGVPAPGPLRCRFITRFVQGGYFEEDGELWDSEGRLVGLSRQFALVARA
jgi:Thioesterase-like superfamily